MTFRVPIEDTSVATPGRYDHRIGTLPDDLRLKAMFGLGFWYEISISECGLPVRTDAIDREQSIALVWYLSISLRDKKNNECEKY
jgi:hypothetical protein